MTFPWKKMRISRLVSDHLQNQKRGGSLVVETGFPTSLVDLFVKNRDRLKKPSKKKKKRSTSPDPVTQPSLSPLNDPKPISTDSDSELSESRRCSTENSIDSETIARDARNFVDPPSVRQNAAVKADAAIQETVENSNSNGVVVAVLKMFLVVVLGLGTKRFAVWITLSAFLLFFLEYVGKHFFRICNKPSSDSQKNVIPSVQITNASLGLETNRAKGEKSVVSVSPVLVENCELSPSTADSNILEQPESNFLPTTENARSLRRNFTPLLSLKEVIDREDSFCETSEIGETFDVNHRNRRKWKIAKVGSKMKKLVPKNLRISKKKHPESKSVTDNSVEVDQCQNQEQEQHKETMPCELESEDQSYGEEEIILDNSVCASSESPKNDSKSKSNISDVYNCGDSKAIEVAKQELKTERVGNLRYWFICLIVLAGLVGGKILALGLTLIWCLVLKSGGISRKYIRVPLFRTSLKYST